MSKLATVNEIKRRRELASMIVETMQDNHCSLLEAYVSLQRLVSDDYTLALAKAKIQQLNEGEEA